MGDLRVLACNLSSALDQGCPDQDHICSILAGMLAATLENSTSAELSDAFYDSWGTIQRASAASDAATSAVQDLLESAAASCNPRELFSLFLESLSESLSGAPREACGARLQLHLLRLLPRLLLRLRRKWCVFLSDYLQMLLRWCPHTLPELPCRPRPPGSLPWQHATPAAPAAPGSREEGAAPALHPNSEPPSLEDVVKDISSNLSCLAVFVLQQQPQQHPQQPQQQPPQQQGPHPASTPAAPTAPTAPTLSAADGMAAPSLLLQAALQLASLVAQLPQSQGTAQAGLAAALSVPPALGRKLECMGPVAGAVLDLPMRLLGPMLCLLPAGAGTGELLRVAEEFARREEMRQWGAGGAGPGSELGEVDEDEEGEDESAFSGSEMRAGAALGLCAAVLSVHSALSTPSGSQYELELRLQLPASSAELLRQLAAAVQLLLDLGAQYKSVALTVLPLYCLAAACRHVTEAGTQLGEAAQAEAAALVGVLVTIMSFNPVELVRSCAHETLHVLLDALQPPARLELVLGMLQMPSSAAAVMGLQRVRQEISAGWERPSEGSPFLSRRVFQAATDVFQQGGNDMRCRQDADLLANADALAAALNLYRFVLLRQGQPVPPGQPPAGPVPPLAVTEHSVRSTLHQDLLPLQAAVLRLLGRGTLGGACAVVPVTQGCDSSSGGVLAPDQPQRSQPGVEELEEWLALQRLLDVVERVVEIAQQW